MPQVYLKDPSDVMDYQVTFASFLGTDTISLVTWTVPTGITKVTDTKTTTTATIWLSGGTACLDYKITCKMVSVAGRTANRSIRIMVRPM